MLSVSRSALDRVKRDPSDARGIRPRCSAREAQPVALTHMATIGVSVVEPSRPCLGRFVRSGGVAAGRWFFPERAFDDPLCANVA